MSRVDTFLAAADAVAALVARVPADAWSAPGLGVWDVRALVGHTGRALTTVVDYSATTARSEDVATPQAYFARMAQADVDSAAVAERGRLAGAALGDDAAAAFADLVARARTSVRSVPLDQLITTAAGGMRLRSYLPTRTFELVVHGRDIAAATGVPIEIPAVSLAESVTLAARIAVELGHGATVLAALTGREPLPRSVRVV